MALDPCSRTPQICTGTIAERELRESWKCGRKRARQITKPFKSSNLLIESITAHGFISTLTRKHDGDVVSSELGNEIERNAARIRHGLIKMPDDQGQRVPEITRRQAEF